MNNRQENIISRNYAVRTFFAKNLSTLAAEVPYLTTAVSQFNLALQKIGENIMIATEDRIGYTEQKKAIRHQMQQLCLKVANALKAYAIQNNDSLLEKKVSIAPSDFGKQREAVVLYNCGQILEQAQTLAAELVPLGISAAKIAELQAIITQFGQYIQMPINQKAKAIEAGKMANTYIAECNKWLKIIDALMVTQMDNFPLLYLQFKGNKKIINE